MTNVESSLGSSEKPILVNGSILEKENYTPEDKKMGSGCGPACVLTAFKHLSDGPVNALDLKSAIKVTQNQYPEEIVGRTTTGSRKNLIEKLNNLNPEQVMQLTPVNVDSYSDFISVMKPNIEKGNVVMVGVGENYLLEFLRTKIPVEEIASIDNLIESLSNKDGVLNGDFDFGKVDEILKNFTDKHSSDLVQSVRFYIATSLVKKREEQRCYWSLQQEMDYVEKIRRNVIEKIIPSQNIIPIDIFAERKKLNIPEEGLPIWVPTPKLKSRGNAHAILVHGIAEDDSGNESYIISDPIESFGPNILLSKKALYDSLKGSRLEILSMKKSFDMNF